MRLPFALGVRTKGSAAIGALGPRDPKPAQVIDHGLHKVRAATLRVQIFVPENQYSVMLNGTLGGNPEGARMANVQKTRGRGREATTIRTWLGI